MPSSNNPFPTLENTHVIIRSKLIMAEGAARKRLSKASLIADNSIHIAQMGRHKIPL